MRMRLRYGIGLAALLAAGVSAQQTGQPATDVLGSEDLWGNPTFLGAHTPRPEPFERRYLLLNVGHLNF